VTSQRWTSGQTHSPPASRPPAAPRQPPASRHDNRRSSPNRSSNGTAPRTSPKKASKALEPVVEPTDITPPSGKRSQRIAIAFAVLLVLLGGVAAFVISAQSAELWEARAELEYRGQSFVETAAISAASRTEIASVAAEFGLPVDDVEERFLVVQAPNSQILELRFHDEDRDRSLALLGEMTDAVVARSGDSGLEAQILLVQQELDRLQTNLDTRRAAIEGLSAAAPTTPAVTADIEQIVVLSRQVADLELRLVDLELREVEEAPVVVTAPYLVSEPSAPNPFRRAMLGALAGLGFAVASLVVIAKRR